MARALRPRLGDHGRDAEGGRYRGSPPVVILTTFSQRELIERARDAGAMAYLVWIQRSATDRRTTMKAVAQAVVGTLS